jgi:hypothetical protein
MIKQNEIKMKLKSSSCPIYMEGICIIQIQRPSRAGALGPIFIIIFLNASSGPRNSCRREKHLPT